MRRQQHHLVSAGSGLAAPIMRRAAGFHQHPCGLALAKEATELRAPEPVALAHLAGAPRHGHLEHGLCQVHCDRRSMHLGLLLSESLRSVRRLWHVDD